MCSSNAPAMTWSNCNISGEGQLNNPSYCDAFRDENIPNSKADDRKDCCWTANHLSKIPTELTDFVKIDANDTM